MAQQSIFNSVDAAMLKAKLLNILCEHSINSFSIDFTMPNGECLKYNQKGSPNDAFCYAMFSECSATIKALFADHEITQYLIAATPFEALCFEIKPDAMENLMGKGGVTHLYHGHFE